MLTSIRTKKKNGSSIGENARLWSQCVDGVDVSLVSLMMDDGTCLVIS